MHHMRIVSISDKKFLDFYETYIALSKIGHICYNKGAGIIEIREGPTLHSADATPKEFAEIMRSIIDGGGL